MNLRPLIIALTYGPRLATFQAEHKDHTGARWSLLPGGALMTRCPCRP